MKTKFNMKIQETFRDVRIDGLSDSPDLLWQDTIDSASNQKLAQRKPEKTAEINARIQALLKTDYTKLKPIIPAKKLPAIFNFFYYLRTESVAEISGVKEIYDYFGK